MKTGWVNVRACSDAIYGLLERTILGYKWKDPKNLKKFRKGFKNISRMYGISQEGVWNVILSSLYKDAIIINIDGSFVVPTPIPYRTIPDYIENIIESLKINDCDYEVDVYEVNDETYTWCEWMKNLYSK